MANKHRHIEPDTIIKLAEKYCDECIKNTREHATGSGKVVKVQDRNVPTVKYFIMHWLKKNGIEFYTRQYFYEAISNPEHPLSDTLKNIREMFDALAEDVVANEGKGIFYAKNRLGMHDKQHIEQKNVDKFDFDGND